MSALLPNLVTLSRGLAGPVIAWIVLAHGHNRLAFWLFVLAVSTDLVDGWLARRLDASSALGRILDPVSDKLLFTGSWVALWASGLSPAWLAVFHLLRDVFVVLGWTAAARAGFRFEASPVAQVMVSFEGISVSVLLFHGPWLGVHWPSVGVGLGTVAMALSVVSVLGYIQQGLRNVPALVPPQGG